MRIVDGLLPQFDQETAKLSIAARPKSATPGPEVLPFCNLLRPGGDSRQPVPNGLAERDQRAAFLLRGSKLKKLSHDHTLTAAVSEGLVFAPRSSPKVWDHILTRCLGFRLDDKPDTRSSTVTVFTVTVIYGTV